MTVDCLIEAGAILTGCGPDGKMAVVRDASIRVKAGLIAQIGPTADLVAQHPALVRHGGPGLIAMPGLVNAHHHFGLTPLMAGVPFAPLEFWLPRFRAMRGLGPRLDTLFSAIEMLESGTTTVHHIHSGLTGTPESWGVTSDATLDAYAEIGMRAGYSFMMRDRNLLSYEDDAGLLASLPANLRDWLSPQLAPAAVPTRDYMDFFSSLRARRTGAMVRTNLAPANLHWCSDTSLQMIIQTARDHGAQVHMHLLETERQALFSTRLNGCTAIAHLKALDCLGPNLTLGHVNWATPEDLDLLAGCGCMVCHNASSGLRLGSGIAPVNQMRARGIPLALGIDQSNIADDRDMTLEMKLVWALHRETGLFNARPDAAEVIAMATEGGARSAGFDGQIGRLEPGFQADIVLMRAADIGLPMISARTPLTDAVLHRGGKAAIDQVFVAGQEVVRAGRVTQIDRAAVMAEIAERLARPETAAEATAWDMVNTLVPILEDRIGQDMGHRHQPYRYNAFHHGGR